MATATAVEIKRAAEQERAARALEGIEQRLARIEEMLTGAPLEPALATAKQVDELKALLLKRRP